MCHRQNQSVRRMGREKTRRQPELLVPLARRGQGPMCAQIQQALRQAIRERRLQPGMVVPSTRTLAADLGVSRGVVVEAYDQLVAEGYLIATPGSATRVTTSARPAAVPPCKPDQPAFEIDFRPGHPDLGSFPRNQGETLADLLRWDTSYAVGSYVLEAGCGVGVQTLTLARKSPGTRITGVDVSEAALDEARREKAAAGRTNVQFSRVRHPVAAVRAVVVRSRLRLFRA